MAKLKDLKKTMKILSMFNTLNEIYINYVKDLEEYFKDSYNKENNKYLYDLYLELKNNIEFHLNESVK